MIIMNDYGYAYCGYSERDGALWRKSRRGLLPVQMSITTAYAAARHLRMLGFTGTLYVKKSWYGKPLVTVC